MSKKSLSFFYSFLIAIILISNKAYAKTKKSSVYYSDKAVVLMYHHISKEKFSSISIRPEKFEADVKMLKNSGFNVISLNQLLLAMDGKAKLPNNAVV